MKRLSCICLPDEKSSQIIDKITQKLSKECQSKKAASFAPHFTIRGDFKIQENKIPELIAELKAFVKTIDPIELKLENYDFYPWRLAFLDIKKDDNLQKLHNGCMKIIEKYRDPWVNEKYQDEWNDFTTAKQREYIQKYSYHFAFEFFSPHFTVAGQDMAEEAFENIKTKLKDKKENIEVRIENLAFFDREDNNKIVYKINLK